MTPAQQLRKTQRELAQHLRLKDREVLAELRRRIKLAKQARRERVAAARVRCRQARRELRDRQRAELFEFRHARRMARAEQCHVCVEDRDSARALGAQRVEDAKRELRSERSLQRQVRHAGKSVVRSTARERRQESDDAVRRNLPAELVPVFDVVRSRIKGSPRRSRTEEFLQWAEENPGEIVALQQADADRYLAELVASEEKHRRDLRQVSRYRKGPDELKRLLRDVPF